MIKRVKTIERSHFFCFSEMFVILIFSAKKLYSSSKMICILLGFTEKFLAIYMRNNTDMPVRREKVI